MEVLMNMPEIWALQAIEGPLAKILNGFSTRSLYDLWTFFHKAYYMVFGVYHLLVYCRLLLKGYQKRRSGG